MQGLATAMGGLIQLTYPKEVNEIDTPLVTLNKESLSKKTVKIICGGGAGLSPAHAGYICEQMLHGSIQGGIFSTSSSAQVKKTIDHII